MTQWLLEPVRNDLVYFIDSRLDEFKARDDDKELSQLALLFLGSETVCIQIIAPGAFHRAWPS